MSFDPLTPSESTVRVLLSASEAFMRSAIAQIDREFGEDIKVEQVSPDAAITSSVDVGIESLAAACGDARLTFIRHLMRVDREIDVQGLAVEEVRHLLGEWAQGLVAELDGPVAVQGWVGESDLSAEALRYGVVDALADAGVDVRRSGAPTVVGVFAKAGRLFLGVTPSHLQLSDWPGGRMRLAKDKRSVSRAEFKLEELFKLHPIPDGAGKIALDLGASPGGWTRIVRKQGYEVWAVDPAEMDVSVLDDQQVHWAATTAGRFFEETQLEFDLVVNDMRMIPEASCQVMLEAADHMTPGAAVVMTLKLAARDAVGEVDDALRLLERRFDIEFARQLFHNRNELTVVGRLR